MEFWQIAGRAAGLLGLDLPPGFAVPDPSRPGEDEDALLNLSNGYDTDGFRLDDAIANQADLDAWQAEEAGSR